MFYAKIPVSWTWQRPGQRPRKQKAVCTASTLLIYFLLQFQMQESLVCILEAGSLPVEDEKILASAGLTLRYGNTLGGPVSKSALYIPALEQH